MDGGGTAQGGSAAYRFQVATREGPVVRGATLEGPVVRGKGAALSRLSRRQFIAAGAGVVGSALTAGGVRGLAYPLLQREDLLPGDDLSDIVLTPRTWSTAADTLSFAVLGDNGSGGRQAMAVARSMADSYRSDPFGMVMLLGDISYYGSITRRFDDVFVRPMSPLIDAGVTFELAVGNHDTALHRPDASAEEIRSQLEKLGVPAPYYMATHGPVDFFVLDSSRPAVLGDDASTQLTWLDDALASSTNQWRVVALHHPLYSSGRHGSTFEIRERLEPILVRRRVDLVLTGHDHHYERTHAVEGVTHVLSGGGCKTTPTRTSDFSAYAESTLEFVHVHVADDTMTGRCIRPDGSQADRFVLRAREGT